MSFNISSHARAQLQHRGIKEDTIWDILSNPGQVIKSKDQTIYQSVTNEDGRQYLIRIFVNHLKTPGLVITAYKTSKIAKYYEGDL